MKRSSELFWFFFFSLHNHPAYLTLNVGPCSTVMLCVQGISAWGGQELGRSGWGWAWSTCLGGGGRGGTCSAHPGCSRSGRAHGTGPNPTDSSCRNQVLWGWQYWAEGVSCAVVLLDLVLSLLVQSRAFAWARSCKPLVTKSLPRSSLGTHSTVLWAQGRCCEAHFIELSISDHPQVFVYFCNHVGYF